MTEKTYIQSGEVPPVSQIGASLDTLFEVIESRKNAGDESYTYKLLVGQLDGLCKKVVEEAAEAGLAATEANMLDTYSENDRLYDEAVDHLRYEAGDVIYHLLVLLSRFGITADELAAEINTRMTEEERPAGAVRLHPEFVRRGK